MKELGKKLQNYSRPYITATELEILIDGTPDSRFGKVKRMLSQGKLLHIRKGLYCITSEMGYFKKPNPFELAQFISWPSYISLESALSYYQLIPEAVYTITSVTGRRSKEFKTPIGLFTYQKAPLENLFTEVVLVEETEHQFFIAKPWKAICDYVFCYRKNWTTLEPLIKSLRLNLENLPLLGREEIELLKEYYHQKRLSHFLNGIEKDLYQLKSGELYYER